MKKSSSRPLNNIRTILALIGTLSAFFVSVMPYTNKSFQRLLKFC